MALGISRKLLPMESAPVDDLPAESGWQFEPKWDGFRCIVFRDGDRVDLMSRRQKPLGRFFPELEQVFRRLSVARFVLDGEIIIRNQSFDMLQLRLHPAASRIAALSQRHPATFVAFDLLAGAEGRSLLGLPFAERREKLVAFFKRAGNSRRLILSRVTRSRATALKWLKGVDHGLDGIVAKRLDLPYQPGERSMAKFKLWKTYDCVVGGLYYKSGTKDIETLLLGLYDREGRLNYVGHSRIGAARVADGPLARKLAPLIGKGGFTGRAPGGISRWTGRAREPVPVKPELVVEVTADHITDERFRHGARIIRWRDDKRPSDCMMDQL
jgi:ATP-dependent DNA ligase